MMRKPCFMAAVHTCTLVLPSSMNSAGIFPGADAADTANGNLTGYGVLRYGGEELECNGFNGGSAIAAENALSANVWGWERGYRGRHR